MTLPIYGTDSQAGVDYAYAEVLPNADADAVLAWARNLDQALEWGIAANWPIGTAVGGWSHTAEGLAFDASERIWMLVGDKAGNVPEAQISYDGTTWTTVTPPAGLAADCTALAANGSGVFVAACDDGTLRRTADLGASWTLPAPGFTGTPNVALWNSVLGLFVFAYQREVAISADGAGWTYDATGLPASFAGKPVWGGAHNAAGLTVLTATAHDKCATSPDGTTWTERSMPVSGDWHSVCWHAQASKFFAVDMNVATGRMASSPDGITWTTLTPTTCPVSEAFEEIQSTGNLLVVHSTPGAGSGHILVSDDDGVTFRAVLDTDDDAGTPLVWAPGPNCGGQLAISTDSDTFYSSLRVVC